MAERILFVDDEPHVLDGLRRTLRRRFRVETAQSGAEALERLERDGPFAVLVSDYRMPRMNGAQLLAAAADIDPLCVRVLLTGHADVDVAIEAVNDGQIFRFLRKPCPPERMTRVLQDCLRHRELLEAERVLLEETLQGSLAVLSQTLSMTNPAAFGLGERITPMVTHAVERLRLPDPWRYRVAAMLSQIGCVTLPPELVEKVHALAELTEEERLAFETHPEVGAKLLAPIPRLDVTAAMVAKQIGAPPVEAPAVELARTAPEEVGAQLLRVTIALDRLLHAGKSGRAAMSTLGHRPNEYTPELVEALDDLDFVQELGPSREVGFPELVEGMVLQHDLYSTKDILLMARGHEVTYAVLQRLRRLAERGEHLGPFRVQIRRTVARVRDAPAARRPRHSAG